MALATVLVGLAMAVGIVGTVVPVLPGLLLVFTACVVYGFIAGWTTAGVVAIAVMGVLLGIGTLAKWALADRSSLRGGAPRRSLLIGAVGAVVGFFVIPVAGLAIGGVGALLVAEQQRTGTWQAAWRSTRTTLLGIGAGVLVEMGAGIVMALVWLAWVIAR